MDTTIHIGIQGTHGAFHEEAARKYFSEEKVQTQPFDSFDLMCHAVSSGELDIAIMAIENSIAGSILQNYRLLRENRLYIKGEVYLRIKHQLMALSGQTLSDIKEVWSHPMALNQCLEFLKSHPTMRRVETEDTALSAKNIRENKIFGVAAIASTTTAELYDLDILMPNIETDSFNYTRFFIIQRDATLQHEYKGNKSSIYIRVLHKQGSLLKVLHLINDLNINISKLQSYPVLGKLSQYFFHLDLEFDAVSQFKDLCVLLPDVTQEFEVLGMYERDRDYEALLLQQMSENALV